MVGIAGWGDPGIRRTADGVQIRLPVDERSLFDGLPDTVRAILRGESQPHLHGRLFPVGSTDPDIERDYRALVGEDLVAGRLAAVDAFEASLEQGRTRRRLWILDLDFDQAHAWLSVINDLRLVLASLAGIESEAQWELGPEKGSIESMLLYHLSWLQEELLEALTATLPEEA